MRRKYLKCDASCLRCSTSVRLVHNIDADAQLSVNIKDIPLKQAASFDVDADADDGIGFVSIAASASIL